MVQKFKVAEGFTTQDIVNGFNYEIAYGQKDENFVNGTKTLADLNGVVKDYDLSNPDHVQALNTVVLAKTMANRSAIIANGLDLSKVQSGDLKNDRLVGLYNPNGDLIQMNSKFTDLDALAASLGHEASHRTIENLRKESPKLINAIEKQIFDAFNIWKDNHPEKERFSRGKEVKDIFNNLEYLGPKEVLVRIVAAKYSGSDTQAYTTKDGKSVTLGARDLESFLNSKEGAFANAELERLERLSLEKLKEKFPGGGEFPLGRI